MPPKKKTSTKKAKSKVKPKAKAKAKTKNKPVPHKPPAPKKTTVAKKKTATKKTTTVASKPKPIADRMKRMGIGTAASPKDKTGTQPVSSGARERQPAPTPNTRANTSASTGSKGDLTGSRAYAPKAKSMPISAYEKHALAVPPPVEKQSDVFPIFTQQGKEVGKGKGFPIGRVGKRQVYSVVFENGHREKAYKVGDRFILVGRN